VRKIMRQPGNLMEALISRAEHAPGDIAFSYLDSQCNVVGQLSNQQLHTRAAAIAGHLQKIISPSDRVLLLFPQGLEFIYSFMGVMYSGAIPVVMAPPRDTPDDSIRTCNIQDVVEETGCNVVLTSTSVLNEVVQYCFRSKVLSEKIFLSVEEIDDDSAGCWSMPVTEDNSSAYLQRTSEKNGKPKFVMISHHNMKNTCESLKNNYRLTTSSRSISWLPHYHYLGLVSGILQAIYCGYRGYIYSQFDFYKNPHSWLAAISKYEVTFSGAPDFAYSMCVEQEISDQKNRPNLSGWNTAYNSGEPVNKETMDAFFKKFSSCGLQENALTSIYGLAESPHVSARNGCQKNNTVISRESLQPATGQRAGKNPDQNINIFSGGLPVPDTQVAIVIPGTRTKCGEQEVGEVLVSSVCNAIGYWNRPEETEKTFNIYLEGSNDGPYLRTGDMGFIKEGEIYIVGRASDSRQVTRPSVNILPDQLVNEKL